jgi:hypothetical protein
MKMLVYIITVGKASIGLAGLLDSNDLQSLISSTRRLLSVSQNQCWVYIDYFFND